MTDQILKLRDAALIAEIRETDFWQMSVGEVCRECDAFMERRKDKAYFEYTNAMAVGLFVSSMFSGKRPPEIEDIYPEMFRKDEEVEQVKQDNKSAANFINFANALNERFQNGNGKPQSENNG